MTLTVLRTTYQVFCRMPLYWTLPYVFITINLGLWLLGGSSQKQSAISRRNEGMLSMSFPTVDIDLDHLAEVVLVRFLPCPGIHYSSKGIEYTFKM